MDSDLQRHHHFQHNNHHNMINNIHNSHHQQQQQQQPQQAMNTGLTRYRSAPSSYFSDLINNGLFGDDDNDPFINSKVSNAETEKSLMKFMSSFAAAAGSGQDSGAGSTGQQVMNQGFEPEFMDSVKQEPMVYNSNSNGGSTVNESMDLSTNLVRQNSSPAGFVGHLDMGHGYPMMRSMDDFRASRGNVPSSMMTSAKRMKNEMGFASGSQLSNLSSGMLPRIPENESKVMEVKSVRNDGGFGSTSWDDSDILSDSFLKEFGESDQNKLSSLNSSDNQRNDVGRIRAPTTLVHHLSLPASSAELDKLMQHQDYVPLRSRAKRGCATHPRSIAERVRRTRISERMRKLQDLVPNMDKQTNTADMLDLAVDYIKELQKEAEALSDHHAKCTCPHKPTLVTQV